MILFPNAKLNIGLNILFKRDDGFHELETLMYPVNLRDILTINKSYSLYRKLKFTSTGINIDGDPENNLIVKAYQLINREYNLPSLEIHLHKSIPFGAGLGGGSADCAFTIKGINDLCQLNLSIKKMEELAAVLGSDCPFFIKNKPAIARGRGEKLECYNLNLDEYYFAIVIPPIPISTQKAYRLIKPNHPIEKLSDLLKKEITNWHKSIVNNFEESIFPHYPDIKKIKVDLYTLGATYAALSGSGSAVFGIFENKVELKKVFPKEYFIWQS